MKTGNIEWMCPYCDQPLGAEYWISIPPKLGAVACNKCNRAWPIMLNVMGVELTAPYGKDINTRAKEAT